MYMVGVTGGLGYTRTSQGVFFNIFVIFPFFRAISINEGGSAPDQIQ